VLTIGAASALVIAAVLSSGGGALLAEHFFRSPRLAHVAPLLGPWTATLAMQILFSESFRGFHAIREAALFGGVVSGILTVLGLSTLAVLGAASLDAAVLVATLSVGTSVGLAAATLALRRTSLGAVGPTEPVSAAAVLRESLPVLVSNLTVFVISNVDVWVVGSHLAERAVAAYAAAARMATLISLAAVVANQVLPPILGELHARGEKHLMQRVLQSVAFGVGIPAVLVAVVFVVGGKFILRIAFGPFYEAGAEILAILTVGQVVCVVTGSTLYTLLMTGHQVASMWLASATALSAVVACSVAVRPFGATGVAIALTAVIVVQQLVTLVVARRLVGVWTHANPVGALTELDKLRKRRAMRD
jgi:O-antigen/teichoic acid export membrane protein